MDLHVTSRSPCWLNFTEDFSCLQFKYQPTRRKSLCPLTSGRVVAIPSIHGVFCNLNKDQSCIRAVTQGDISRDCLMRVPLYTGSTALG